MTPMQKIQNRLRKLERQKGYIFGMLMAEKAHEAGKSEKEAIEASFALFRGKDRSLMQKGFRSQKKAIEKRKAKEEGEQRNLFNFVN